MVVPTRKRAGSAARASPGNTADEERTELLDELGGLPRLSHGLYDVRKRVKVLADESDHEVVVVRVEAVTREPHVVREILRAVGSADRAVLAQDAPLLAGL